MQGKKRQKKAKNEVLPRFELRFPESESDVITSYTIEPFWPIVELIGGFMRAQVTRLQYSSFEHLLACFDTIQQD